MDEEKFVKEFEEIIKSKDKNYEKLFTTLEFIPDSSFIKLSRIIMTYQRKKIVSENGMNLFYEELIPHYFPLKILLLSLKNNCYETFLKQEKYDIFLIKKIIYFASLKLEKEIDSVLLVMRKYKDDDDFGKIFDLEKEIFKKIKDDYSGKISFENLKNSRNKEDLYKILSFLTEGFFENPALFFSNLIYTFFNNLSFLPFNNLFAVISSYIISNGMENIISLTTVFSFINIVFDFFLEKDLTPSIDMKKKIIIFLVSSGISSYIFIKDNISYKEKLNIYSSSLINMLVGLKFKMFPRKNKSSEVLKLPEVLELPETLKSSEVLELPETLKSSEVLP